MKKTIFTISILLVGILFFSGCATQPTINQHGPGFLIGLWHGICAPISLIVSLFKDIRIYEYPNSGFWYDLGFIIGIGFWGGGAASSRKRW